MPVLESFYLFGCTSMIIGSVYLRNWLAFGGWLFAAVCEGQILMLLGK